MATKQYALLERRFLDGQAGLLAASLQENAPCPVCGSREHPSPAVPPMDAPTEAELKQARSDKDRAHERTLAASAEAGKLRGEADAIRRRVEALAAKMLGEGDSGAITSRLKEKTAALQTGILQAKTLAKQLSEKVKRKNELDRLQKDNRNRERALSEEIAAAKSAQAAARAGLASLEQERQKAKAKLTYPDQNAALHALEELRSRKKAMETALETARKAYHHAENELAGLQQACAVYAKQLEGTKPEDADAYAKRREKLLSQLAAMEAGRMEASSRRRNNERLYELLRAAAEKLSDIEKRWRWVQALSDTANGELAGKEKLQFETYVQAAYFDMVIVKANQRFAAMTGGQYELIRRDKAENRRSQTGLELDVIDHFTGTFRSVSTLSGGESFKASLALALGLSDVVQAHSGGIQLDAMFIDEGFGSLDEESLKQAMDILTGISSKNRLVGIISHVGSLKERIDKKIIVQKSLDRGSTVSMEV